MTRDELRAALEGANSLRAFARSEILNRIPWIFAEDGERYTAWQRSMRKAAGARGTLVSIVGSAATGYSLSPSKAANGFRHLGGGGRASDIDIALVSDELFTRTWEDVLSQDRSRLLFGVLPRVFGGTRPVGDLLQEVRQNIYFGAVADRLAAPGSGMAARVRLLNNAASRDRRLSGYQTRIRIYRRVEDLEAYHERSLSSLLRTLRGLGG